MKDYKIKVKDETVEFLLSKLGISNEPEITLSKCLDLLKEILIVSNYK